MKKSALSPVSTATLSTHVLPDGSCIVRRSAQEFEIWGANISEHYTIRIQATDDAKMDVIYLGGSLLSLKH